MFRKIACERQKFSSVDKSVRLATPLGIFLIMFGFVILFNLRFQLEIGQLENPRKIEETKRDIARIKTTIRESNLSRT